MHVAATLPPHPALLGTPMPGMAADADPLQAAGSHAIVCGPHGLDMLCRLLHAGAASVTLLRDGERPAAACADLLIATAIGTVEQAAMLACNASRALTPGGRARITLPAEPHDAVLHALRQALRLHGFTGAELKIEEGRRVLLATRAALHA